MVVTATSSSPNPSVGRSTKEQLVLTAERLFAIQGIEGVSLRNIAVEARMANSSVVQYHFGSKDGLVDAILLNRLHGLARRRELLTERSSPTDLRAVVEAQLLPVVELGEDPDCYYLMFLEQLQLRGISTNSFESLPPELAVAQRAYFKRLTKLLPDVPPALLSIRTTRSYGFCLHLCTDRQRTRLNGGPVEPYALHVAMLLDGIVAFLSAPPSDETLAALGTTSKSPRSLSAMP